MRSPGQSNVFRPYRHAMSIVTRTVGGTATKPTLGDGAQVPIVGGVLLQPYRPTDTVNVPEGESERNTFFGTAAKITPLNGSMELVDTGTSARYEIVAVEEWGDTYQMVLRRS